MSHESGGNTWAVDHDSNGTTDYGAMQINSIHARLVQGNLQTLFNPTTNIQVASEIWQHSGWCAWTTAHELGLCE